MSMRVTHQPGLVEGFVMTINGKDYSMEMLAAIVCNYELLSAAVEGLAEAVYDENIPIAYAPELDKVFDIAGADYDHY